MVLFALAQAAPGGALAVAADVAIIIVAAAVLVLALLGIFLFFRLNRAVGRLQGIAEQSMGPVSDRARAISDNVEFITQAVRTDVEKLSDSVEALTERLHLASERMEQRVEEFNALMEVVQDEAEEIFLDTAATVRGVREGARAIGAPRSGGEGERPEPMAARPREPRGAEREAGEALRSERAWSSSGDDAVAAGEP
jgi:methyl-accepting chemotaxis protein